MFVRRSFSPQPTLSTPACHQSLDVCSYAQRAVSLEGQQGGPPDLPAPQHSAASRRSLVKHPRCLRRQCNYIIVSSARRKARNLHDIALAGIAYSRVAARTN